MSFQAMAWAIEQKCPKPTDKLLLLGLADRHNTDYRKVWPSQKWLEEFSGLNRKTVITGMQRLVAAGLVADTGQRVGKTKSVKVMILAFDHDIKISEPENGTARDGGERKLSLISPKLSQKRDTEPIKEPVISQETTSLSSKRARSKAECPDDFWPEASPGTLTHERTMALAIKPAPGREPGSKATALDAEVEKFIAYHQTRGNKYKNWQQCWTTWTANNFGDNRGNGSADEGRGPANPMVRAAVKQEAEERARRQDDYGSSDSRAVSGW